MNVSLRMSTLAAAVVGAATFLNAPVSSALLFNQNVTSNVILGTDVTNGSFTVDRSNNVELGLRGKLRHDAGGDPQNIFNSNGAGDYNFATGVAPTQSSPTAVWSFEWSINSDLSGTSSRNLNGLRYQLGLDTDVSQGTNFSVVFDPIKDVNPGNGTVCWDHSLGTNATAQSAGIETACPGAATYATNLGANNLAQNSWKAHWFFGPGFDPTVDATYDIYLAAFDANGEIARSSIQIIVGAGGAAVPAPATLALLASGLLGLGLNRRARNKA